jgi:methylase of polypeptide subunit release factors
LRAALSNAGYTAEAIAEPQRLRRFLPATEEVPLAAPDGEADGRLAALVNLLALGRRIPADTARAALAPAVLEDVVATGLLTVDGGEAVPNYALLPRDGLFLAGDGPRRRERDVVSPFTRPSLTLARLTPRTPRRSMLDLGTGSGILALMGAAHCHAVAAIDINPRALMFARFNAALNETDNVELLEGSWFEPVAGRRFDLITGNPPYVISPDHEFTYRDSGMPGAELIARLCRETADHLQPGGVGILLTSWPHRSEDDWPLAPTGWVTGTGCDAVILHREALDALEHAANWNSPPVRFLDPDALRETVARWGRYYRSIDARMISFGAVVLRRRESGDPWLSALEAPGALGERASEQLIRILRGHDQSHLLDDRALLATPFSLPVGVDVAQRFQRRHAGFVARPAMVSLADGLGVRAAVDPDALDALFACDGTRPLIEIVEDIAAKRGLDPGPLAEIVAGAARELLAHGLLEG